MILDTNALSAFIDGDAAVGALLRRQDRAAIPVIVLGEFRYGILGSRQRKKYEAWLEQYVPQFDVLSVTHETTIPYSSLRAFLKSRGRPIPANDVWIAALAVQHSLPVLSKDQHFDGLPGVKTTRW